MDGSSLAQLLVSAHTAELTVRAVGHRLEGLEHEAADLRWRPIMARQLGWNLCRPPARR